MRSKRFFPLLLLVLLVIPLFSSIPGIPRADASSSKSMVLQPRPRDLYKIIFSETENYIKLNNTIFTVEFYKGSFGYNKIYNRTGSVLVYDERVVLEYLQGKNWKQIGVPTNIDYIKVSDYEYNVTRYYTDYLGTLYEVTWNVKSEDRIKSTITILFGKSNTYRVAWSLSGIPKTTYKENNYTTAIYANDGVWNETLGRFVGNTTVGYTKHPSTSTTFSNSQSDKSYIVFDWKDVYQSFGNITRATYENVAQGKKASIFFNIGSRSLGSNVILDPSTLTLRPNADGTYSQFVEVPNSGFVFGDQFESNSLALWTGEYDGSGNVVSDQVHHGFYSYKVIQSSMFDIAYLYKTFSGKTSLNVRMYFRINATFTANWQSVPLIRFTTIDEEDVTYVAYTTNGAGQQCLRLVRWYPTYSERTPVVVGMTANAWHCIELGFIKSAVGGEYRIYFDGVQVDSNTGLNTSGAFDITRVNVCVTDTGTDDPYTYWFDCVSFSTSYIGIEDRDALVSDSSDNTALQVTTSTTQKCTMNLANNSTSTATINSVTAYTRAKTDGSTADKFKFQLRTESTDYSLNETALTTSFAQYSATYNVNPNTLVAWTWTEVNALELGSIASALASGKTEQFSEYWIVVTYTEAGGQTLSANIAQTITFTLASSRAIIISRPISQTITLALSTQRLIELSRGITQTITFSLASSRTLEVLRSISETLSLAFSSSRMLDASRDITQDILFTTSTVPEAVRSIVQTISFSLSTERIIELSRTVSQAIGFSTSASRLIELSRGIEQTISFAVSAVGFFGFEYDRAIQIMINFAFGTMGVWMPSTPYYATPAYVMAMGLIAVFLLIPIVLVGLLVLKRRH